MENVIDVYTRPEDSAYPVVCMNEMPKQLIADCREAYRDEHGAGILTRNMSDAGPRMFSWPWIRWPGNAW